MRSSGTCGCPKNNGKKTLGYNILATNSCHAFRRVGERLGDVNSSGQHGGSGVVVAGNGAFINLGGIYVGKLQGHYG